MKRVLVTGGGGFVGANLARRLVAAGHEVTLFLHEGQDEWRLRGFREEVRLHLGDLASAGSVAACLRTTRPEWVFHLAAHGAYSFQRDEAEMRRTNCQGTATLVDGCLRAGVDIMVHTGSSSEYGFKDHAPDESEPVAPNSGYARTKAWATRHCTETARREGVPLPTVRLYSAYGPFEDPRRLMPALALQGLAKRWPPLVAPETARDFVHVDDVCDALLALAANPPEDPGAVFNLGTGEQTTLRELAGVAGAVFGISGRPVWNTMANRSWDTDVWRANPAKIRRELGWRPKTTLADGLRGLADWLESDCERLRFYLGCAAPA